MIAVHMSQGSSNVLGDGSNLVPVSANEMLRANNLAEVAITRCDARRMHDTMKIREKI
jgi:hypothetical protein